MMQVQEPQLGSAQPLSTRTAWSMIDPTEGPGWMYVVPLCVWADIKSLTEVPPPVLPSFHPMKSRPDITPTNVSLANVES